MLLVQHERGSILPPEAAMNFIFMLTRRDQTVEDCLDTLELVTDLGVRHIGFKDVGAPTEVLKELDRRIKLAGAVSYMEVVSVTPDRARQSLATARDIGVDRVLGGTDIAAARQIFGDLSRYFPFAGRPSGTPPGSRGRLHWWPRIAGRTVARDAAGWTCSPSGRPRPTRSTWCGPPAPRWATSC
jgi:hypothetical protein